MLIIKFILNDIRYRFVCAFSTNNAAKDDYARMWNNAFDDWRLSLPCRWADYRGWQIKLFVFQANIVATLLRPVWFVRGY